MKRQWNGSVHNHLGAGAFPCDSLAYGALSHLIKARHPFSIFACSGVFEFPKPPSQPVDLSSLAWWMDMGRRKLFP
jgi:hypothetical protein